MLQQLLTMVVSRLAVGKTISDYEKNQKENIGTLKPPIFVFVVGMVDMLFFAALIFMVCFSAEDTNTKVFCSGIFGAFVLLGLYLVLYERNYKVLYKDGMITRRNMFRVVREYACKDIEHAYYKDNGGIQFVFTDGRKLSFAKEEQFFYREIVKKEHLQCKFKGEDKAIIKVYLHPLLMCPCWIFAAAMLVGSLPAPRMFLFSLPMLLFCLGGQLSFTTYDKEKKIVTRTICGFSKQYNMNYCLAKPVYENGFLMAIEITKENKRVAKIPVSTEYKNRAKLIRALCGADA